MSARASHSDWRATRSTPISACAACFASSAAFSAFSAACRNIVKDQTMSDLTLTQASAATAKGAARDS